MHQHFTRGIRKRGSWLAVVALLAASAGCGTQATTQELPQRSSERAEFERIYAEWKAFLGELRQLKKAYDLAEPGEQSELEKQYQKLRKKGEVMETALVDAVVDACVLQPEENQDLASFLNQAVRTHVLKEEYEEGLRLAQILIENRVGDRMGADYKYEKYVWAVIAGCAAGRFETAEQCLQVLDKNQVRLGRNNPYQPIIDECRRDLPYYKQAWAKEEQIRKQEALAGDLPRVLLKTNKGDIELELFENEAPNTVANFISLVEKGFYNGLTFHWVEHRVMAQAGCPKGNGTGDPGYYIRCECYREDHRLHFRGSLSMAHGGRDTGGSQFLITFRPAKDLDGKHTVFGRVVRGIEVLARLQRRKPPKPIDEGFVKVPKADVILEARVLRKRDHPYDPKIILKKEPDIPPEELLQF